MDSCSKYFFVVFNIFYIVFGALLIGFAVWLKFASPVHELLVNYQSSMTLFYSSLVLGCVLVCMGVAGTFGTVDSNTCVLAAYLTLVVSFLLAELGVGIYIIVTQVNGTGFYATEEVWTGLDNSTKDIVQERFQCCGYNSSAEYGDSPPCSCYDLSGGQSCTNTTVVWSQGCYDQLQTWARENIILLAAIAVVVLAVEIFQTAVTIVVIRAINEKSTGSIDKSDEDDQHHHVVEYSNLAYSNHDVIPPTPHESADNWGAYGRPMT